jgi:hypothetical protein
VQASVLCLDAYLCVPVDMNAGWVGVGVGGGGGGWGLVKDCNEDV